MRKYSKMYDIQVLNILQLQVQSLLKLKKAKVLTFTVTKFKSKTKDDINKAIDLLWTINRGSFITRKAPQVIKIRLC